MLLRIGAVKAVTGERSNSSVYANIRAGLFPKSVQIGKRAVGWPEHEVMAVCAARIAGKSDVEIRELVRHLVDRRANDFDRRIATLGSTVPLKESWRRRTPPSDQGQPGDLVQQGGQS